MTALLRNLITTACAGGYVLAGYVLAFAICAAVSIAGRW